MNKRRHSKGMWEYLDSIGVLEKGSDIEIKAAKALYRKKYLLAFKRKQRSSKPEYNVNFSKENGEHDRILKAAGRHKMTVTAFVRSAALAYIDNTFLVPNREQVARLEQILSNCLNEIKAIAGTKERFWEREQRLERIEKRIERMEAQIHEVFTNPSLVSRHDSQNQIS